MIKSIVSTGLGRLHFIPAVQSLNAAGVSVEIIQGWVPRATPNSVVTFLGQVIGSPNLAASLAKRRIDSLPATAQHSCVFADFYAQALLLLPKMGIIRRGNAARLAWRAYGWQSQKFIRHQEIFHVRSGAGRGGAIATARQQGLNVVVDHSIAHPAFLLKALKHEYEAFGFPFWMGPDDPFWGSVLDDCNDADLLLVNSQFVKDTFVAEGYPEDKIFVAYLGVRDDFLSLKQAYNRSRQLNLLFTGGFGIRKGAHYLLKAAEKLIADGADISLTVVGSMDEATTLLRTSPARSRLNSVGFIPQEELKKYLAAADIYVFPSLAEGCASSGLEAMAAGLPVIATPESGLPIRHGEDGWLVPSKSASAIAEAILLLGENVRLRRSLGVNAAARIRNRFRWRNYADAVKEAYSRVLSRR